MKKQIQIFLFINILCISFTKAQNNLIIQNCNVIMKSNYLILNNTKFSNSSSTFQTGSGTTVVSGNASTVQSQIGGSSPTTFYNLIIHKSANNAALGKNTTITNQLTLSSGKLELGNHNLTIGNTGNISGQNKDRYLVTNGTGTLIRQVGNSWTAFPIGKSTFNPARLKNAGTVDNFNIRVVDHFLQNGMTGNAVTTNVIPRTWLIDEATTGGSNVSMRLIWRPLHHNNNGFNTNNSAVTHYTSGSWQDQTAGASTADNSYSSDHRYREATNITSFSPFSVKSVANLPVELLYFYAEKEGDNVRLDWQTATEINNSHFDVEWSKDGINFQKIGKVAGAGTTAEVQFYDFVDNPNLRGLEDLLGLNYYRLRQVDFDGKYEYTDIIIITFTQSNNLTFDIYPNPAAHYLKIESEDLVGEIVQIFNVNGQLVKEFQHQSLITNLPITNLPSGVYFIKVGQQVKKLIIEK